MASLKQVPTLTGPEAVHNDALAAALAAVDQLVQQEKAEAEPSEDDLAPLVGARVLLEQWATHEAGEYADDDSADDVGADDGYAMSAGSWSQKSAETLIRKSIPAGAAVSAEPEGKVRLLINSTGVFDMQRDKMVPGCWAKAIERGQRPKLIVAHQHDVLPLGKCTGLSELLPGNQALPEWHLKNGAGALIGDFQIDMSREAGRDLFAAISGDYISEFSVGFLPRHEDIEYRKDGQLIKNVEALVEVSAVLQGASPKTQVLATKSATKASVWRPTTTPTRGDPRELIIPNEVVEAFIQATNSDVPPWIKDLLSDSEIEFVRAAVRAGLAELAKESLAAILVESELARRFPERSKKAAWLSAVAEWRAKSDVSRKPQRDRARFSIDTPDGPKFPINDCSDVADAWGLRGNSSLPKERVERHIRRAANVLGCDGPWNGDASRRASLDWDHVVKSFTLTDEPELHIPEDAHELSAEERIAIREDAERRRRRSEESTETPSADMWLRHPAHRPTPEPTT